MSRLPKTSLQSFFKRYGWRIFGISIFVTLITASSWAMFIGLPHPPLYGYFLHGQCACNHEIFFVLEEFAAYEETPGHRERIILGRVVREGNSATIVPLNPRKLGYRIEWDGSRHTIAILGAPGKVKAGNDVRMEMEPVNALRRTLLPRCMPDG